jgi:hypothetical protein
LELEHLAKEIMVAQEFLQMAGAAAVVLDHQVQPDLLIWAAQEVMDFTHQSLEQIPHMLVVAGVVQEEVLETLRFRHQVVVEEVVRVVPVLGMEPLAILEQVEVAGVEEIAHLKMAALVAQASSSFATLIPMVKLPLVVL